MEIKLILQVFFRTAFVTNTDSFIKPVISSYFILLCYETNHVTLLLLVLPSGQQAQMTNARETPKLHWDRRSWKYPRYMTRTARYMNRGRKKKKNKEEEEEKMRCEFFFSFLPKLRARKLACRRDFLGSSFPGEKFTFEVKTHRERQRELCKWRAAGLIALMQLRFLMKRAGLAEDGVKKIFLFFSFFAKPDGFTLPGISSYFCIFLGNSIVLSAGGIIDARQTSNENFLTGRNFDAISGHSILKFMQMNKWKRIESMLARHWTFQSLWYKWKQLAIDCLIWNIWTFQL